MISCRKASELLSKEMDEKLSPSEELALKFHIKACVICEQFRTQLQGLRSGLRELLGSPSDKMPSTGSKNRMPDEMRRRLSAAIRKSPSDEDTSVE